MSFQRRFSTLSALLFLAALAPALVWAIPPTPSATTLTIGPSAATAGQPITLTATVTPQLPVVPTGVVVFTEPLNPGLSYSVNLNNGVATLILEPATGSHTYLASFQGDAFYAASSGSATVVITASTSIVMSAAPNPALFGQTVTLSAAVTPPSATGTVTFYERTSVIGVAPVVSGTATLTTTLLPAGLRNLYARYSGDNSGDASSVSLNISEAVQAKPGLGFGPPRVFPTGIAPLSQVAGDFNLDGKVDIAVLNAMDLSITVFLGNGDGTFTATPPIPTGANPMALVAADFNGDGYLDLAVAATDGVEVFNGSPTGLAPYVTTSIGGPASSLAVADFAKTGFPGIVATSGSSVAVLLSTGPSFTLLPGVGVGAASLTAVGVGDFNNDGLADIVAISSAGVFVLINNSNLNAVTPTYSFVSPVNYSAGNGPSSIVVKDVNGDSNQDLLVTNYNDGTVSVLLGNGTGAFRPQVVYMAGPQPTSLAVSDFNGDGKSDLIVTNDSTYNGSLNISVLLGNGGGVFRAPIGYAAEAHSNAIIVADFNGDAKPDIAVLSSESQDLEVFLDLYATLTVIQGSGQSAAVNNTFPVSLQVSATAFDAPMPNVQVIFTAPQSGAGGFFAGSGASALAISNANGVVTAPAYTANAMTGGQTVLATAGGNSVSFVLMNNPQTCTFVVSPSSVLFDAGGGSQNFTVVASAPNCMWNATSVSSSVLFGSNSGTGNGSVNVLFPANSTAGNLTETIWVAGVAVPATILQTAQVFEDVVPADYYFNAVNLLWSKGITAGCSASPLQFCPGQLVTRAQAAIFIVRTVLGDGSFSYNQTPYFTDVPSSAFGFSYIQKLYELGITAGCGNGQFCPDLNIPRDQMAIFVTRGRYGATTPFDFPTTPFFTDVPSSDFAFEWVQRMAADHITSGCGGGNYCPSYAIDRGDMAIFLMRAGFNQLLPPTMPVIASISPAVAPAGETTTITVNGLNTNFVSGVTSLYLPAGITGTNLTVTSPTTFTIEITPSAATAAPLSIWVTTGAEEAVLPNALVIPATI